MRLLEKNDSQRTGVTQATTIQPERVRLIDGLNQDRVSKRSSKSIVSKVSPVQGRMNVINEDSIFEVSASRKGHAKNSQSQLPLVDELKELSRSR